MPYTNLQAAFTLGIINLVLNLMKCLVAISEGSDGLIIQLNEYEKAKLSILATNDTELIGKHEIRYTFYIDS